MTDRTGTLKKTPLHEEHVALEGKMVPFAGFAMPVQYPDGIQAEHRSVRESAALFDVSHMGEFEVRGPDALTLVQRVTVNDASSLEAGQAQYSAICSESGGILDDLLVYRLPGTFMLVVNAANRGKVLTWIQAHAKGLEVEVEDRSDAIALLAIQGPRAQEILSDHTDLDLDAIGYYRAREGAVKGVHGLVSRTGYTGEDGFELYLSAADAPGVWRALLEGGGDGLRPAGLGARDTLRLEAGLPLYGNDLDEEHTPFEAGLGWIVKLEKGEFVGREALARQKESGVNRKLSALRMVGRGFPRPGYPVIADGERVGEVTSGTVSPSLGVGIALSYLPLEHGKPGSRVEVRVRSRDVPAEVQRPPFYTEGSVRR